MGDRGTKTGSHLRDWGILGILWLLAAGIDQVWLAIDHGIPSWDPADHLIGALNYWWTLQPQHWSQHWLTGHVWTAMWTLSSKYPPLLYASTAPFLALFGKGADQAISVNLLYTAILLSSVYGLGRVLFRPEVGLWAAGICLLFPQFYSLRTGYYMDYPLTTLVVASILTLTLWWRSHLSEKREELRESQIQWVFALSFGFTFGLALLAKQTAVFFLAIPLLWMGFRAALKGIRQQSWSRFGQLCSALLIALLMILPWSQSNWLFQISAVFNSNIRSARIEGDPGWDTLAGWLYYWQQLPQAISYPLLVVPIVGLILGLISSIRDHDVGSSSPTQSTVAPSSLPAPTLSTPLHSFLFLSLFLVSIYAIWSAIANKDSRYIMPWLPLWSIVLAYGLLSFPKKWHRVKWITVGVSVGVMVINLFPIGGGLGRAIAHHLAPGAYHQPYLGQVWPHDEIIEEIIATQPYQIANVGVLPSTPEINQHNLTLAGNRHNFQVYARRMGKDRDYLERDIRSLSWFISVSAPNLDHHDEKSRKRQREMLKLIRQSGEFKRHRVWELPDGSKLRLFRRQTLPVEVEPLDNAIANVLYDSEQLNAILALLAPPGGSPRGGPNPIHPSGSPSPVNIQPMRVHLDEITVPQRTPPGYPVPITYQWSGSWSMLHDGLVFLTWHRLQPNETPPTTSNDLDHISNTSNNGAATDLSEASSGDPAIAHPIYPPNRHWFHDHRIGLGTLYPQIIQANQAIAAPNTIDPLKPFTVT
ncbi:MAG: phospholipid carrier-dependent glycosyltransferase, partial [Symploca sp. SIO2B6]|nr:phospholipid carrier-dependent glycosyltransferase [Symploca sp. SIO2B6]